MKLSAMLWLSCPLFLCQFAHAQDKPKFVSQTFQDILRRADYRDKESQAIITVRGKPDTNWGVALSFSIEEVPSQKEVIVALSRNSMTGRTIYEQYRLRIDEAITQELRNQKQMVENQAKQRQKFEEEQTQKIRRLTGGTLHFGMSPEAVEQVKGKPLSVESALVQQAGHFTLIYPDMVLRFFMTLQDVTLKPTPSPNPTSEPPSSTSRSSTRG